MASAEDWMMLAFWFRVGIWGFIDWLFLRRVQCARIVGASPGLRFASRARAYLLDGGRHPPPRGLSRALDAVDADAAIRASIVTPAADMLPALFIERNLPVASDHDEDSHHTHTLEFSHHERRYYQRLARGHCR